MKTKNSKFLSYVLRHNPAAIGIELDRSGWVAIDDLLAACARHGRQIAREQLSRIVAESDKQRFAISPDGLRIRASQGHSIEIELGYEPVAPPEILYHGTADRNLAMIKLEGLRKQRRHHVHLSAEKETALKVGRRFGHPAVLEIRSGEMHRAGYKFYLASNGVWLTDHVPPGFIRFP